MEFVHTYEDLLRRPVFRRPRQSFNHRDAGGGDPVTQITKLRECQLSGILQLVSAVVHAT
jgi:hypothetical protein